MTPTRLEAMHDQIRAIYRAVTGSEMSEPNGVNDEHDVEPNEVVRRFADLEAVARSIPDIARRVPPFSFLPPLDVIEDDSEMLLEIAVPGVDRADVHIAWDGSTVTISGLRRGARMSSGRSFVCAEIPRGPFSRSVTLPFAIEAEPRVHVDHGMVFVHVAKPARVSESTDRARHTTRSETTIKPVQSQQ